MTSLSWQLSVSDGSVAMLWTVEGGVYGVRELNCSKSCRTAGGRTRPATPQNQANQTNSSLQRRRNASTRLRSVAVAKPLHAGECFMNISNCNVLTLNDNQ